MLDRLINAKVKYLLGVLDFVLSSFLCIRALYQKTVKVDLGKNDIFLGLFYATLYESIVYEKRFYSLIDPPPQRSLLLIVVSARCVSLTPCDFGKKQLSLAFALIFIALHPRHPPIG